MALVPLAFSDQSTPGARATREAFSRKSLSPRECSTSPCAVVSSTMLWVLAICSYSVSMTGAAYWNRKRLPSTTSLRSHCAGVEKSGLSRATTP